MSLKLPDPSPRNVAVRVTRDALRQVRSGHPWVFDRSVTKVSHDGHPGDLAIVFDQHRNFAALGLWDPGSPIRVRILSTRPVTIGPDFWRDRLVAADQQRNALLADPSVTGIRRVHGENDRLPGLVADQYDDTLVVKLYSAVWFAHLRPILEQMQELWAPTRTVIRLARNLQGSAPTGVTDGLTITGHPPHAAVAFVENGHRMLADPVAGQKTGYFLDQRANRLRVQSLAAGARVLDVFCCHGGFSVHAAAGGARSVHAIDLSPHATAAAADHLAANCPAVPVTTTTGDAFAVLDQLGQERQRYDLVVVDPPSFASRASSVPAARAAYRRLTAAALAVVADGGTLVQASCSSRIDAAGFREIVVDAARQAGYRLSEVVETGHDLDHPIGFAHGAYLKAIFSTVARE